MKNLGLIELSATSIRYVIYILIFNKYYKNNNYLLSYLPKTRLQSYHYPTEFYSWYLLVFFLPKKLYIALPFIYKAVLIKI